MFWRSVCFAGNLTEHAKKKKKKIPHRVLCSCTWLFLIFFEAVQNLSERVFITCAVRSAVVRIRPPTEKRSLFPPAAGGTGELHIFEICQQGVA